MTGHTKWKNIKHKSQVKPKYTHLTVENATKAGESAFKARILFFNNPYREQPLHGAWIRGFKRAERAFFEAVKLSQKIQESLELEEVEA